MNMKIKKGRRTITTDVAYMAGFFDGEGCIRIKKCNQKGNSYQLICHVCNSNKCILERFQECFGGRIMKQERTPNKTIYQYYITCAEASDMLKTLYCFLYEKYAQATVGMEFHKFQRFFDKYTKEHYYKEMRRLKK